MELKSSQDLLELKDGQGLLTLIGFGSLLSVRSARSTFPDLLNFQAARVKNFRRIFAHTAAVFHQRGIADVKTGEVSSLSCEECSGQEILVSLFQIPANEPGVQAFIEREHEFRFLAVPVYRSDGHIWPQLAVLCGRWNDADYKAARCSPDEFYNRYTQYGISRVWSDSILPCRIYLRHCVLAAQGLGAQVHDSFLDHTYLADRKTTIRQYLAQYPAIMEENPPSELVARYSG